MTRARWISWLRLAVWSSWLAALHAWLVTAAASPRWVPDVGVVLLVACATRFSARDVPKAALVVALARVAYSVEPPSALLAGFLAAALLVRAARSALELGGALARSLVAGGVAWTLATWLVFVHASRAPSLGLGPAPPIDRLTPALASALLALIAGPLLARLPGLSPLAGRRW